MELGKIDLAKLMKKYENNDENIEKYNLKVDQIINDIRRGVKELHSLGIMFINLYVFFKFE